jgi:hypothetical protein
MTVGVVPGNNNGAVLEAMGYPDITEHVPVARLVSPP